MNEEKRSKNCIEIHVIRQSKYNSERGRKVATTQAKDATTEASGGGKQKKTKKKFGWEARLRFKYRICIVS